MSNTEDLEVSGSGVSSGYAGAGSLEFGQAGNRIVQVIHESVREFFLRGSYFGQLSKNSGRSFVSDGHLSIIDTCMDYINIAELDALVEARCGRRPPPVSEDRSEGTYRKGAMSVHSFESAFGHGTSNRRPGSLRISK